MELTGVMAEVLTLGKRIRAWLDAHDTPGPTDVMTALDAVLKSHDGAVELGEVLRTLRGLSWSLEAGGVTCEGGLLDVLFPRLHSAVKRP